MGLGDECDCISRFELEDFSDAKIDAILQMDFDEFIEWQKC